MYSTHDLICKTVQNLLKSPQLRVIFIDLNSMELPWLSSSAFMSCDQIP